MHIFKINTAAGVSELFCPSPLLWIWSVLSRVEEIPGCSWGERDIKTSLYFCYCEAVLHLGFWHKCAALSPRLPRLPTQPRLATCLHPPGLISASFFIVLLIEALPLLQTQLQQTFTHKEVCHSYCGKCTYSYFQTEKISDDFVYSFDYTVWKILGGSCTSVSMQVTISIYSDLYFLMSKVSSGMLLEFSECYLPCSMKWPIDIKQSRNHYHSTNDKTQFCVFMVQNVSFRTFWKNMGKNGSIQIFKVIIWGIFFLEISFYLMNSQAA